MLLHMEAAQFDYTISFDVSLPLIDHFTDQLGTIMRIAPYTQWHHSNDRDLLSLYSLIFYYPMNNYKDRIFSI